MDSPKTRISIVNGPNLNLLGLREPHIYGHQGFDQYFDQLKAEFRSVELNYFQSNHEGKLIDYLHEQMGKSQGIVLNAGGLTHTSVALADAVAAIQIPTVEVHISNTFAREQFRHKSFLSRHCSGIIIGLGLHGYRLAIQHLLHILS